MRTYAFICYEDESVDLEEFTVFGRTYEQVQELVATALADGKAFKVVPFGDEDESHDEQEATGITEEKIRKAERCLIDNGIDEDEADTVLQALGYILLDTELYGED